MALARNADRAAAVTKSDSTLLQGPQSLWVGGLGDVVVIMLDDYDPAAPTANTVTFTAVPAGTRLPIRVAKVMAATTATLIVAMW